jgi:exonuclease SbcC/exonuclease SbcD
MTIKIAHCADLHFGMGYAGPSPSSRFDDICRVADFMADRIIEENCDLVLVAGDLFKDARVFLDRASVEIAAAVRWLRRFSEAGVPVVVISGTPSHDAIAAYELIKEMRILEVHIFTSPGIKEVYWDGLIISVVCLPGINRSTIASREEYSKIPAHELHQLITDRVTELTLGLAAQCEYHPKILLSHITCAGADKGFEDLLMQHEPVLTKAAIEGAGFDLVCLGHIHKAQQVQGLTVPTFYCGSPERLNFSDDQNTPGFWVHEPGKSRFIETPARRFLTIVFNESDLDWIVNGGDPAAPLSPYALDGATVRVRYSCSEEVAKRLDRKALERAIYDSGAFFIHDVKAEVQRQDRARDEDVTEAMGPVEALGRWAQQQEIADAEIVMLQSMTAKLLEEVAS